MPHGRRSGPLEVRYLCVIPQYRTDPSPVATNWTRGSATTREDPDQRQESAQVGRDLPAHANLRNSLRIRRMGFESLRSRIHTKARNQCWRALLLSVASRPAMDALSPPGYSPRRDVTAGVANGGFTPGAAKRPSPQRSRHANRPASLPIRSLAARGRRPGAARSGRRQCGAEPFGAGCLAGQPRQLRARATSLTSAPKRWSPVTM